MTLRTLSLAVFCMLVVFLASQSPFVVGENEQGLRVRLGEVVDDHVAPGLHFRIPLTEEIHRLDRRVQLSDSGRVEYLTAAGDAVMADAYVVWRIDDARRYWQATGADSHKAALLLLPRVQEGLRQQFARGSRQQALAGMEPAALSAIVAETDAVAWRELGVRVVDVGLRSTGLSAAQQDAIYKRMRAERESESAAIRAEGAAQVADIRSRVESAQARILAEAYEDAEKQRGEGDAAAAAITGRAYGSDPAFYRFFRALQAYRTGFSKPGDVMVLKSDSEFLRFMKRPEKTDPRKDS